MLPQIIEFSTNHPIMVSAFAGLLGVIFFYELRNFTQKFPSLGPTAAVSIINDDNTVLLDVREMNEIQDGMINKAVHIPLSSLKTRLSELDKFKNGSVMVYCRSGTRSGSACRTLNGNGFEKVYNLAGGILAWQEAHLPLKKSKKKK